MSDRTSGTKIRTGRRDWTNSLMIPPKKKLSTREMSSGARRMYHTRLAGPLFDQAPNHQMSAQLSPSQGRTSQEVTESEGERWMAVDSTYSGTSTMKYRRNVAKPNLIIDQLDDLVCWDFSHEKCGLREGVGWLMAEKSKAHAKEMKRLVIQCEFWQRCHAQYAQKQQPSSRDEHHALWPVSAFALHPGQMQWTGNPSTRVNDSIHHGCAVMMMTAVDDDSLVEC